MSDYVTRGRPIHCDFPSEPHSVPPGSTYQICMLAAREHAYERIQLEIDHYTDIVAEYPSSRDRDNWDARAETYRELMKIARSHWGSSMP